LKGLGIHNTWQVHALQLEWQGPVVQDRTQIHMFHLGWDSLSHQIFIVWNHLGELIGHPRNSEVTDARRCFIMGD
jgi:hypothetical protein